MNKSANFLAKWLGKEQKFAQMSALQSTSDANMHGIEQQFASLTSQITADNDTDAINNDIKRMTAPQNESGIDYDYHLKVYMPPIYFSDTSNDSDSELVIPFPPKIKNERLELDTFDDGNTELFDSFYKCMKHVIDTTELTKFTLFYKCGHCHLKGKRSLITKHKCSKVKVKKKISGWYKCMQCDLIKSNKKSILNHISEKHGSNTNNN
eukprot:UN02699